MTILDFGVRDAQIRIALIDFTKTRVSDKPTRKSLLTLTRESWSFGSMRFKAFEILSTQDGMFADFEEYLGRTMRDTLTETLCAKPEPPDVAMFSELLTLEPPDDFDAFLINSIEISALEFDRRNRKNFFRDMTSTEFVEACFLHQRTVPFAVHFLRQYDAHLFRFFGTPHHPVLLQHPFFVVAPLDGSGSKGGQDYVLEPEEKIEENARVDVNTWRGKYIASQKKRHETEETYKSPGTIKAAKPDRPKETKPLVQRPARVQTLTNQPVEFQKIFVQRIAAEIRQKKLFHNGPQPWNFPISHTNDLPESYSQEFALKPKDVLYLCQDEEYVLLYMIQIQLLVYIPEIPLATIEIVLISLQEMFVRSMVESFFAQVFCVLANMLIDKIRSTPKLLKGLNRNAYAQGVFALAVGCNVEKSKMTTESFFMKAQSLYQSLRSQKKTDDSIAPV